MRRSTLDVRLGRQLAITQVWQHVETGTRWHVRQVHRADCHVELELEPADAHQCIRFEELRHQYVQVTEPLA